MKRLIAAIGLLLFLFSFSPICFAEKVYEDPESDVRFIVPDTWISLPTVEGKTTYKAVYEYFKSYNSSTVAVFRYDFMDIYSTLPSSMRKAYSREMVTNEIFSLSDISALLNISESEIREETHSGIIYFVTDVFIAGKTEYSGLTKIVTPAKTGETLVRINNGYLYKFTYYVSLTSTHLREDVEGIINSIVYSASTVPYVKTTVPPATIKPTSANHDSKLVTNVEDNSHIYVIGGLLIMGIFMIGGVVSALKHKK